MNDLTPDETEAIDSSSSQKTYAVAFGHLRRSLPSGSVLTLCLMAAFADGEKHEREREQIRRIAESFRGSEVDLSALRGWCCSANRNPSLSTWTTPSPSGR